MGSPQHNPEQHSADGINPVTGAPRDYESLIRNYHGMILSLAEKAGIDLDDREDAAAEVELRFIRKDGLSWYDPTRLHEPPPGGWRDGSPPVPRTAKFGGMFRSWARLSMLQEVERHQTRRNRVSAASTEHLELISPLVPDPATALCAVTAAQSWLRRADAACRTAGRDDLLPTLCALAQGGTRGKKLTSKELALVTDCTVSVAARHTKQLRTLLDRAGMGPISLGDVDGTQRKDQDCG